MSAPEDTNNPGHGSADYFSRRVTRHAPWTEDLVTIDDSEEDTQDRSTRSPALLSPVQSDLLTPATLSPPVETTETSPLLDYSPQAYQYASTSAPVVCCRAGGRPADIPPNVNANIFPNGPPQDMGGYRGHAGSDLESNKFTSSRRRRQRHGCCGSKYLHRWIMALGFLTILILLQHCVLGSDSDDLSDIRDSHCFSPFCTETFTHSFDKVETFAFVDELGNQLPVKGTVYIEPAQEGQEADMVATISYGASARFKVSSPNWKLTDSSMHLQLPTFSQNSGLFSRLFSSRLSVAVTLHLKLDVALDALSIDTTHLAIVASPHLFNTNDSTHSPTILTTKFTTHSTPITLAQWTSRHTILKTSSSPITGSFTLLDLLVITSQSGSIAVTVDSGAADSSNPQPAHLSVSTSSGSVRVDSSTTNIYEREYKTDVKSSSGTITGTYLLGAEALFTTSSGTISLDVLPYDSQARGGSSSLRTHSSSGATRVNVLGAYRNGGKAFTGLRSSHESSGSGSLTLRYPGEWEGKITADVSSGSISVKGSGVVVDEAGQYGGHVRAHKGEGDCSLEARTGSASVDVVIG